MGRIKAEREEKGGQDGKDEINKSKRATNSIRITSTRDLIPILIEGKMILWINPGAE